MTKILLSSLKIIIYFILLGITSLSAQTSAAPTTLVDPEWEFLDDSNSNFNTKEISRVGTQADASGTLVFSDDFDLTATFVENWEATSGIQLVDGQVILPAGHSMRLRQNAYESLKVVLDISVNDNEEAGGFSGLMIDGFSFLIRRDGSGWVVYTLPGETSASGYILPIDGFTTDVFYSIAVSRQMLDENTARFIFKINDQIIASFIEAVAQPEGLITVQSHRMTSTIDNFMLYRLQDEELSPNVVINSSFEYLQEGMPTYFDSDTFRSFKYEGTIEQHFDSWKIDTNIKHSGNQSLRIEYDSVIDRRNSLMTFNTGVTIGEPMVFSLYLKASTPDLPVRLVIWEMRTRFNLKNIVLSTTWQRYDFILENPERSMVRAGLWLETPGVVWVDDIQIEKGSIASEYSASSLDAIKFPNEEGVSNFENSDLSDLEDDFPASQSQNQAPLVLYAGKNYYMNEASAVIVGKLQLPDPEALTGVASIGTYSINIDLSEEFVFEIPLGNLATGDHTVTFDVFNGSSNILQDQVILTKKPYFKDAIQIDHQRRSLIVDGEPFLVIAPLVSVRATDNNNPQKIKRMVDFYEQHGFKSLMLEAKYDAMPSVNYVHQYAKESDIKVITWINSGWKDRETISPLEITNSLVSEVNLGWLAIDEPELYAESQEVEDFLTLFRANTPYHPTFMNNTILGIPANFANLNTDILMLDDYLTNRENRQVEDIVDQVDIMNEAGEDGRKPSFYFLVGNNMHNHYREPTFGEQVAQSYGTVIAGSTGLSYFMGLPSYPENWKALKQLNAELLSLQPVIFSLQKIQPASVSDNNIRFTTRRLGNRVYVIAVNMHDSEINVEVTIPSLPIELTYQPEINVQFEGRTITVNNNKFSDTFKPHERHVYYYDISTDLIFMNSFDNNVSVDLIFMNSFDQSF